MIYEDIEGSFLSEELLVLEGIRKIFKMISYPWFDFLHFESYLWFWLICHFLNRKFRMILPTSLLSITHWMSQAGSLLSLALLNAVSTPMFSVAILMCLCNLNDLIAWESCFSILFAENQKECSIRRARTKKIFKYWLKNKGFAIPATAWNLGSPCSYND